MGSLQMMPTTKFIRLLEITTGIFWCYAGVVKIAVILTSAVATGTNSASNLFEGVSLNQTWVETFPVPLIIVLSVIEISLGFALFVRKTRPATITGLLLLMVFALVFWFEPPQPGQSCGCFGTTQALDNISPASKLLLLGGIHALLLVSAFPRSSASTDVAPA